MIINYGNIETLIALAIDEDIGSGDITSELTISANTFGEAGFYARENMIFCGGDIAAMVFAQIDAEIEFELIAEDGQQMAANAVLARVSGNSRNILAAERIALNFMQRMSGIATKTRKFVDAVAGSGVKILDTRKTIPCYRLLDKYAVKMGGGYNHRMSLSDAILIKDNHIQACGSLSEAINNCRENANIMHKIAVECDNLQQVREAISCKAEHILLDNMSPQMVQEAIVIIAQQAKVEVSGGINLQNVKDYAINGVDYISIGSITHSAPAVDIGLDWGE